MRVGEKHGVESDCQKKVEGEWKKPFKYPRNKLIDDIEKEHPEGL